MKEKIKKQEEKDLMAYLWANNEFWLLSNRIGIIGAFNHFYNRDEKFTELANQYIIRTIYKLCNEKMNITNTN